MKSKSITWEIPALAQAVQWWAMGFDDYKVVLYRNQPDGWVAEAPAIPGCHALMPTREDALVELAAVFRLISEEYAERDQPLLGIDEKEFDRLR